MDRYWTEYIDILDQLKKVINLQAIGQKDPIKEYVVEAFDMFEEMNYNVKKETINHIYKSFV